MSVMSYNELVDLVSMGAVVGEIGVEDINGASIDITLGERLLIEKRPAFIGAFTSPRREGPALDTLEYVMGEAGYLLEPGEFILAHSQQMFFLPDNVAAEYKLRSSLARIGLNNALAGWCDPGWHNSVLTLELTNTTRYHSILLKPGDPIGQMVFYKVAQVPAEKSYRVKGRYNGDKTAQGARSLKPCVCGNAYVYPDTEWAVGQKDVEAHNFIECHKCQRRTAGYSHLVYAVEEWNNGVITGEVQG